MPTWPASLPQKPRPSDFGWIPPDLVEVFEPDAGPLKVRGKASVGISKLECTFDMDETQRAAFMVFWETTLVSGLLSFDWAHPITGVTKTFRISGPPAIKNVGEEYFIKLSLLYTA